MTAARELGAAGAHLVKYATSGDVWEDRRQVVGYASLVLAKGQKGPVVATKVVDQAMVGADQLVADRGRVDFVRDGSALQYALGPLPMFHALVRQGSVERVLPQHAVRGAPVHVVWPSRRFEPAAVARFREAVAEALTRSLAARG